MFSPTYLFGIQLESGIRKLKYPSESYTLISLERSNEDSVQLSKKSLELLSIAQKERAADQTDAAAVLAAEEALEGALKDLSDDSMSLLTTVYEILDVIILISCNFLSFLPFNIMDRPLDANSFAIALPIRPVAPVINIVMFINNKTCKN